MKGKNDSDSIRLMAAAVVVIVAVVFMVILGFQLLHRRQEIQSAYAQDTKQEDATIRIEALEKEYEEMTSQVSSDGYATTDNEAEASSEESLAEEEKEIEEDKESEKIYLVKGEEKKSNKYDRTDKLSYTDSIRYTKADLEHLDRNGLRITRNEIFARHGRMFNDQELQKYFDGQSWYVAQYSPSDFDDSCLNDVEVYNVNLILSYELERGYH